ncbi:hypothetical protein [Kitasatospora viridis]|uniref:Uncharacterized protein n=1 Tax=Kitasatospora viridis TaxID=281105 RepID=A0A561TW22_9ACTN|nr:hypothetical protein [Kitasatospora viridis]TWF91313.1 hypothetical protein FHX73_12425 [Kitasatospora viridis]
MTTVTPTKTPVEFGAARRLCVTPRYLAGSGYQEPGAVAAPLIADAGWLRWTDAAANVHVTSPCGRGYFGYLPAGAPEPIGLWQAWARAAFCVGPWPTPRRSPVRSTSSRTTAGTW